MLNNFLKFGLFLGRLFKFGIVYKKNVCSIKPLSKDITSAYKLFYEKVDRYHLEKEKYGQESRRSGLFRIATQ